MKKETAEKIRLELLSLNDSALGKMHISIQITKIAEVFNNVIEEHEKRIDELENEIKMIGKIIGKNHDTIYNDMIRYKKALEVLAVLGNEPHLGNSIGNKIAQHALLDSK